ncbi:alpha/beta-hydrolase [Hesseltinella vesiculosa]|uniref:triacylglycerol lipase n=1 Tax=Hesseltinella vesiculosa TaxID=101127 RepID=A0A1X2GIS9_9FUNG|nr:alpha/beta-hydrolase [Hesseltinella vesiculosa]
MYLIYVCIFILLAGSAAQQYVIDRPIPPAQTLSLRRMYYLNPRTNQLTRLARHPQGDPLASESSRSVYRVQPILEQHSVPSQSTLQLLRQTAVRHGKPRWHMLTANDIAITQNWNWVPDIKNQSSVLALAKMCYDAYTKLGEDDWYDIDKDKWHVNDTFGWDGDGLRGHVFGNQDNSLLVIAIKGTTAGLFSGGPTGDKDKQNDNLLFSCCCGRVSRVWKPVCNCFQDDNNRCEESCVQDTIMGEELYYDHAVQMYLDLSDAFPDATIWLTGHSLGGGVAALVGQTFGLPAVSFEAPGDRLASLRLHLPRLPKIPIWHFGNTADPIFIGECQGIYSSCWYGGFAIETHCHSGKTCVWDTVKEKGWRVDIRSHRIGDIIEKILLQPDVFSLPECVPQTNCSDCSGWDFYDDRDNALFYLHSPDEYRSL